MSIPGTTRPLIPPTALARTTTRLHPRAGGRTSPGFGGKWILIALLLTIFEGAIRKWFIPGTPAIRYAVYFSKDIAFVCAAVAGMAYARQSRKLISTLCAVSLVGLLVPTLVNLSNTPGVGALLSLRAYLVLPLCAFVAAYSLRSLRDVDWIVSLVGVSAIVVAAIGIRQFSLPATDILNTYEGAGEGVHIITEYGHVRATGTFSFMTGMGIMAGVGAWAGVYLFLTGRGVLQRVFAVAVLFAGLSCGLVSMVRGGIILYVLTVLGGVVLFRQVKESLYLLVVVLAGFWLTSGGSTGEESVDPGLGGAVARRFENADTPVERLGYVLMNLRLGLTTEPLGVGLGRGQIGGNFAESGGRSAGRGYESELGRIGFEVGILGFFGVVIWRVAAIVYMTKLLFISQDTRARALLAASVPLFSLLSLNYMAFNHTGSSFGWAIVALAIGAAQVGEVAPGSSAKQARIGPTQAARRRAASTGSA
jgi:hypothetical protein